MQRPRHAAPGMTNGESPSNSSSMSTSAATRRRMQTQRVRDTEPEIQLRRELFRMGLRFRKEVSIVPGTRRRVDIAFMRPRVAVFVDGCFWHGCPEHGAVPPKTNSDFWSRKIALNRQRDADSDMRLRESGWSVIRVWEHDDLHEKAIHIADVVRQRSNR